ncbi:hypothetical protein TWF730_003523 [Orbilia blumenaviensis]|uniref:Uncharacterized protein n=1 Tax=Orbilia blumenaviensis TaxID=1796055 RepID=A0AAV9U380_9PEZI
METLHLLLWNRDNIDQSIRPRIFRQELLPVPTYRFEIFHLDLEESSGTTARDLGLYQIPLRSERSFRIDTLDIRFLFDDNLLYEASLGASEDRVRALTALRRVAASNEHRGLDEYKKILPCGASWMLVRPDYIHILKDCESHQGVYETQERVRRHMRGNEGKTEARRFDRTRFVVTGEGGIGKTWLLSYILVDRLLKGLVTVYVSSTGEHTLFTPDGVSSFQSDEVNTFKLFMIKKGYLTDSNVWYLTDTVPAEFVTLQKEGCKWRIVETRRGDRDPLFDEGIGAKKVLRYMRLWEWHEIFLVADYEQKLTMYESSRLYKCFKRYDPVPRILLDILNPTYSEAEFQPKEEALKSKMYKEISILVKEFQHQRLESVNELATVCGKYKDSHGFYVFPLDPEGQGYYLMRKRHVSKYAAWAFYKITGKGGWDIWGYKGLRPEATW